MSGYRLPRKVVLNQQPAIDWESVYKYFEQRFIDEHLDDWRHQFLLDSLQPIFSISNYVVGQIINLASEGEYDA